ncbi:hypothetical protein V497_00409 [Pseudogymnoascus sp. VKM F-4516 (FW-969)]|nr:hypothetical protein V497_00409 [Pseudogymnoascus sp. VKM F-4516 (FW-969)]
MRRLQGRNYTLKVRQRLEALKSLRIRRREEGAAPAVLPRAQLGTDARVVQAGGHGVGILDLAMCVLEDVGAHAVQDALTPARQRGGVLNGVQAVACGFDAANSTDGPAEKGKNVRAAAYTRHDGIGEFAPRSLELSQIDALS